MARKNDLRKQYDSLVAEYNEYNRQYYDMDSPAVDDATYDALVLKIREIEESNPKLATKIKQLYPKDKATGYSENQVRGIFVVNLPK